MKSPFIRSSVKIKADPGYYLKKYQYFVRKHEEAMEAAGRNRDVQPPDEPKELTRRIVEYGQKREHYLRRYYSSLIIKAEGERWPA